MRTAWVGIVAAAALAASPAARAQARDEERAGERNHAEESAERAGERAQRAQEQAVPMLEKFLSGSASRKLRDRALFVLTQSGSPRGRALVADIARGKSHPDLQRQAVKYLGLFGGEESRRILSEVYASTEDDEV